MNYFQRVRMRGLTKISRGAAMVLAKKNTLYFFNWCARSPKGSLGSAPGETYIFVCYNQRINSRNICVCHVVNLINLLQKRDNKQMGICT
ncbi:hypothetical protein HanIR_Chr01g0048591 [Helianthus annuus]|nr:hypothetical protein HanIR_Chr01g0048591 [Helianthus annuus]